MTLDSRIQGSANHGQERRRHSVHHHDPTIAGLCYVFCGLRLRLSPIHCSPVTLLRQYFFADRSPLLPYFFNYVSHSLLSDSKLISPSPVYCNSGAAKSSARASDSPSPSPPLRTQITPRRMSYYNQQPGGYPPQQGCKSPHEVAIRQSHTSDLAGAELTIYIDPPQGQGYGQPPPNQYPPSGSPYPPPQQGYQPPPMNQQQYPPQ
jgi:hypothetical protein